MNVTVFHDPSVVPLGLLTGAPLYKLAEVDSDWRRRFPGLLRPSFAPATVRQLERVHDPEHVRGVLSGTIRNGFGTRDPSHAASALADVGAFVAAARHAATTGQTAASIGGGFHHAGYARSHAFCTFNGLMAAAADLIETGIAKNVAILDLDNHFGDGTQDIRTRLGMEDTVQHYVYAHEMLDLVEVDGWLDALPETIEGMHARGAGIILYNAGVDSHRDDPMTRGVLTTEQLRRRERMVFGACARLGLPVAWTLAGGYQKTHGTMALLHGFAMEAALDQGEPIHSID